jgi:hypothetical protein
LIIVGLNSPVKGRLRGILGVADVARGRCDDVVEELSEVRVGLDLDTVVACALHRSPLKLRLGCREFCTLVGETSVRGAERFWKFTAEAWTGSTVTPVPSGQAAGRIAQ